VDAKLHHFDCGPAYTVLITMGSTPPALSFKVNFALIHPWLFQSDTSDILSNATKALHEAYDCIYMHISVSATQQSTSVGNRYGLFLWVINVQSSIYSMTVVQRQCRMF
jgi:hypothetical protein